MIIEKYFSSMVILYLIIVLSIVNYIVYKKNFLPTVAAAFFSYGLSTCIRTICTIPIPFLMKLFPLFQNDTINLSLIFLLTILVIFGIFKIRRFSQGFQFIQDPEYDEVCIVASTTICCAIALLQYPTLSIPLLVILWIIIIVSALLSIFWIRKSIKRKYKDTLKTQEIQRLNETIAKLQAEVEKLTEENKRLSAIIHKDNKLLNAMLLAVDQLIYEVVDENDPAVRKEKCEAIRAQLQEVAGERASLLASYEFDGRKLPSTGNSRIDSLLAYFHRRAFNEKIGFEMTVDPKFMAALQGRLTDEELSTLLADLLENAVIATRSCEKRSILLSLELPQNFPVIAVYDSGVPFPDEVRAAWGKAQVTMHADTGGSGIGMMTIHEICTKNRAEFLIEDSLPGVQFTKRITISFP